MQWNKIERKGVGVKKGDKILGYHLLTFSDKTVLNLVVSSCCFAEDGRGIWCCAYRRCRRRSSLLIKWKPQFCSVLVVYWYISINSGARAWLVWNNLLACLFNPKHTTLNHQTDIQSKTNSPAHPISGKMNWNRTSWFFWLKTGVGLSCFQFHYWNYSNRNNLTSEKGSLELNGTKMLVEVTFIALIFSIYCWYAVYHIVLRCDMSRWRDVLCKEWNPEAKCKGKNI